MAKVYVMPDSGRAACQETIALDHELPLFPFMIQPPGGATLQAN